MLNVIWWLITVEAVGLVAFPLAYQLLPRLKDRGYSVSKPLGILLIGYVSWILSAAHILPSVRLSMIALLVVLGALSGRYAWRHRQEMLEFVKRERVAIVAAEAVFLAVFLLWVGYRVYDPSISHTEKPMDFGFLNAAIRNVFGSPEDPWLRGESVSYYYFGYWMMGALSQMTGIVSSISYNLSLALIPALGAMGVFGLVYNLVRTEQARLSYALASGLLAAGLLGAAANLEGLLEFMRANGVGSQGFWAWIGIAGLDGPAPSLSESWRPEEFWWWWRATRVINTFSNGESLDYTIQEFPVFSYILGDLHPHVMSVPFIVLFLALCFNFSASRADRARIGLSDCVTMLVLALSLGGLGFTNSWDLPVFSTLLLGVVAVRSYTVAGTDFRRMLTEVAVLGGGTIGLAVLLYLPYYLSFNSQFSGLYPVTAATTRPIHLLIIWALALVGSAPFVLAVFWRTTVREDWRQLTLIGLSAGFAPFLVWAGMRVYNGGGAGELVGRFLHVLPFALLIGAAVYSALWLAREKAPASRVYAMVLSALGLTLIMAPELIYVGDIFDTRMNTVFKLYYQAWAIMAVVCGFALHHWAAVTGSVSGWGRSLSVAWAAAFVILLAGSLYYAPAAAASKGKLFHDDTTLDGLEFVSRESQAEYAAIAFVRENVGGGSAILEAVGGDYTHFGRVSSSTGVPTVLGWPGHELQWRGSSVPFEGRESDVARIYDTHDPEEARTLLAKYNVDYVYVGPRERSKYRPEGLEKFSGFMETVFREGGVVIYRGAARPTTGPRSNAHSAPGTE